MIEDWMRKKQTGDELAIREKLDKRLIIQNESKEPMVRATNWISRCTEKIKEAMIPSGSGIIVVPVFDTFKKFDEIHLFCIENKTSVRVVFSTIKKGN